MEQCNGRINRNVLEEGYEDGGETKYLAAATAAVMKVGIQIGIVGGNVIWGPVVRANTHEDKSLTRARGGGCLEVAEREADGPGRERKHLWTDCTVLVRAGRFGSCTAVDEWTNSGRRDEDWGRLGLTVMVGPPILILGTSGLGLGTCLTVQHTALAFFSRVFKFCLRNKALLHLSLF